MADHYVKLWASILDSSVWREPEAHRIVWITMLTMADKNGFVGASIDGLARRANVSEEQVESALESFLSPDPRSRNQENYGIRIQTVPRGWHILNHGYFRDLQDREMQRQYERTRKAEQRSRSKDKGHVPDSPGHSEECPPPSSDADADSVSGVGESTREEGAKKRRVPEADKPDDVSQEVWDEWVQFRRSIKAPVTQLAVDGIRREAVKASITLQDALGMCVTMGWRGFRAEWISSKGGAFTASRSQVPKILDESIYDDGPVDEQGFPLDVINRLDRTNRTE